MYPNNGWCFIRQHTGDVKNIFYIVYWCKKYPLAQAKVFASLCKFFACLNKIYFVHMKVETFAIAFACLSDHMSMQYSLEHTNPFAWVALPLRVGMWFIYYFFLSPLCCHSFSIILNKKNCKLNIHKLIPWLILCECSCNSLNVMPFLNGWTFS